MEPVAGFSEQGVQAELERIRRDYVDQGDLVTAAAACRSLVATYPESKWLGNILLLAAACYHQLGQGEEEIATLRAFLESCPGHVQTPTIQRRLEVLQTEHALQNATSVHLEAIGRLEARLEALEQRLAALEQASEQSPAAAELAHAFAEDMNRQVAEQRAHMEREISHLHRRLGAVPAPAWFSRAVAAATIAALTLSVLGLLGAYRRPLPAVGTASVQAAPRPAKHAPKPRPTATITPVQVCRLPYAGRARETGEESLQSAARTPGPLDTVPKPTPSASNLNASRPAISQPMATAKPKPPAAQTTAARPVGVAAMPAAALPKPAASPAKPAPKPTAPRTYRVQAGDTLWSISTRITGNGHQVARIAAANGLVAPYNVRPGQVLVIPR